MVILFIVGVIMSYLKGLKSEISIWVFILKKCIKVDI